MDDPTKETTVWLFDFSSEQEREEFRALCPWLEQRGGTFVAELDTLSLAMLDFLLSRGIAFEQLRLP